MGEKQGQNVKVARSKNVLNRNEFWWTRTKKVEVLLSWTGHGSLRPSNNWNSSCFVYSISYLGVLHKKNQHHQ